MRKKEVFEAYLDDPNIIRIFLSKHFYEGRSKSFYLSDDDGHVIPLRIDTFADDDAMYNQYVCWCDHTLDLKKSYRVFEEHARETSLQYGFIVKHPDFDKEYCYDGPLGVHVGDKETVFRLWAPTATRLTLILNESKHIEMHRNQQGVFEHREKRNLHDTHYYYLVHVNGKIEKTLDPYGLSGGPNGIYSTVIDIRKVMSYGKVPCLSSFNMSDMTIAETSIRDFTYDIDMPNRSSFQAYAQKGLKRDGYTIGFDYLRDMGFSHVQLMPVNDFETVDENNPFLFYNWGYDPAQYFALEGSYGTDVWDGMERMVSFKKLVNKFHENDMRVVVDVVFNHVYDFAISPFEKTLPFYYFRFTDARKLSNGSFCGNDIDSQAHMMRRYIIDVLRFYVEVYDVDGFRFDLMGILDVDTLQQIETVLRSMKPDIVLYGEGWNMPTALNDAQKGSMYNAEKLPSYGFFNDFYRDIVKGHSSEDAVYTKGYLTGDLSKKDAMVQAILGQTPHTQMKPHQIINYVECHDNFTLWDKIKRSCNEDSKETRILKHKLVSASVFLARGIPFIQLGQEFCRSKNGVENSYRSDDAINKIDWTRRIQYDAVSRYIQDLIALRKREPLLSDFESVRTIEQDDPILSFYVEDTENRLHVVLNPTGNIYYKEYDKPVAILFNEAGYVPGFFAHRVAINPFSVLIYRVCKTEIGCE